MEPMWPPRLGDGNGRKPKTNQAGFQALREVLVTGMPWVRRPVELPSSQTAPRRVQP